MRTLATILVGLTLSGCIVLKKDHDVLTARVSDLESSQHAQSQALQQSLSKADELAQILDGKLKEAELLLRRNQADLGVRVEQLELQFTQLDGAVENAEYVASAVTQGLEELRSDVDGRLKSLEQKLQEATNIPEDKDGLWREADRQQKRKNYPQSRRLWRTYVSRYPSDAKLAEVRFNIGLTYFSERDYKAALGEFYRVVQESPNAAIIPDSLYYSGLAFAKIGQCKNAIAYFQALQKEGIKAPERYRTAAGNQIAILKKDTGDICADKNDAAAGAAAKQSMGARQTPR